jgi:NADPH-dependent 2,4-dienoyl-CoA reductase/sulfur reductase-like enzyme
VVIGGDAGGMSAASQARRRRADLEIVAFERGDYTSYSACGIPYWVGGVVDSRDRLIARTPEVHRERFDIDVRLRHEVEGIDLDKRTVAVGGTNEPFDHLVIATGAVPIRPDLPGIDAEGIYGIQTLNDGEAVRRALDEDRPQRAVVVGGGYIGLEMAEAFVNRGLQVALVDLNPQPMSTLDADMGALVADALEEIGVELHRNERVEGFETRDGRLTAVATSEHTFPADIVVLGLGSRPNSALARDAGIGVGVTGGIRTDLRMRTDAEHVWAAGDCVETFHRISRRAVAFALGTHANKQGRVAGINIGGGYATFRGVVGTAVSKICSVEVARTGLGEQEAERAGFDPVTVSVESSTRAGYFPGAAPITVKMIAERRSGRLLGAQIVGKEGAAKRIDVVATALWNEMTVHEIEGMDLSYAPPFSPVWDPVLIAARKAAEAVEQT